MTLGWLRRNKRRDRESRQRLFAAVDSTYEDFIAEYQPEDATGPDGADLLLDAANNNDPSARVKIANRILDDGARASATWDDGTNALQLLLTHLRYDIVPTATLVTRLLDSGLDVNLIFGNQGTPLEQIALIRGLEKDELTPLYDAILARPDIDVLKTSAYGQTPLFNIRRWEKPVLARRVEDMLRERGIPVPPEEK